MTIKVGIDIGHGSDTFPPGKGIYRNGRGYEEHDFNSKLGIRLKELLEANGIQVVFGQQPFSLDVPLGERRDIYVAEGCDLVVSVHANYNSNTSVNGRCVFYWHTNTKTFALAEDLAAKFKAQGYSTHGSGIHASIRGSWTNLFITRALPMYSILIEHGFMNGSSDFHLVFGNKQAEYVEDMAQIDAQAIVEYFGKSYKSKKASGGAVKAKVYYRVQVGAFKETSKVAAYANEVEKRTGFETYVTRVDGWLKVQVGAFANKKNADQRLAAIKKAGYMDAFITTKSGQAVAETEPFNDPTDRAPAPQKTSWQSVAKEIYDGVGGWGNNPGRKQKLEAAGYNYLQVQNEVNRLSRGGAHKVKYPLPNATYKAIRPYPKGSGVRQVQEALASIYYYPDKGAVKNGVDGSYGPKTADAVRRFQSMYGLAQDGIYGPATRRKLDSIVNK